MAFETRSDHIVWSRDYSIKEFLSAYGKKMPQIVKVTQGFHGDYQVDSISTHDILRVHTHSHQKRVIGQDMYGQHLSLPVNFDKLLQLVVKEGNVSASPPCTLKSLLDRMDLPFKVRLPNVTVVSPEDQDLGVFRLDSQFEQRHLLVNYILVDKLETRIRMIPSSLGDVRLAVGKGFDKKSLNWKGFLLELNEVASSLDYNGISGTSDIALYASGTPAGDSVPYENLVPRKYLSVKGESLRKKSLSSLGACDKDKSGVKAMLNVIMNKVPGRKSSLGTQVSPGGHDQKTSSHYETVGFPTEDETSPVSSGESGSAGIAGGHPHSVDMRSSPQACPGVSISSEPPPPRPLDRTARDKPLPSRLGKELPQEPYVYSVRRRAPKQDSCSPPGTDPKPVVPTKSFSDRRPSSQTLGNITGQRPDPNSTEPVIAEPNYTESNVSEPGRLDGHFSQRAPLPQPSVNPTSSQFPSKARKQSPPVAAKPKMSVKPIGSDSSESTASPAFPITSWFQVPNDLSPLSCDQIAECLQLLRLDQSTIDIFRDKQLNGAFLKLLSEDDLREFLKNDTGLSLIDREKTINFIKHKWRPR